MYGRFGSDTCHATVMFGTYTGPFFDMYKQRQTEGLPAGHLLQVFRLEQRNSHLDGQVAVCCAPSDRKKEEKNTRKKKEKNYKTEPALKKTQEDNSEKKFKPKNFHKKMSVKKSS